MGGGGQRDGQSRGEGGGEVNEGRDGRGRVGAMNVVRARREGG